MSKLLQTKLIVVALFLLQIACTNDPKVVPTQPQNEHPFDTVTSIATNQRLDGEEAETATPPPTPTQINIEPTNTPIIAPIPSQTPIISQPLNIEPPTATPTFAAYGITQTVGISVQGRPIVSHRFGFGTHKIVVVGGIHGGYEWNTILLSYQLIDYFAEHGEEIPNDVTLYIIPSANPDGQYLTTQKENRFSENDIPPNTEPGRFNANLVDLNRNWSCDWSLTGYWGERVVQTGEHPFSEPETIALSRFLVVQKSDVVVFLHSAADGVFMGGCPEPLLETEMLAAVYSDASGYPIYKSFSSYPVTGDASDWLATQGIPSFSVELLNHTDIEFEENLAAVQALIAYFNEK